ncbi:hypothetical protein PENNAL_c0080G11115, partial [Penicillium nalgiovense]
HGWQYRTPPWRSVQQCPAQQRMAAPSQYWRLPWHRFSIRKIARASRSPAGAGAASGSCAAVARAPDTKRKVIS